MIESLFYLAPVYPLGDRGPVWHPAPHVDEESAIAMGMNFVAVEQACKDASTYSGGVHDSRSALTPALSAIRRLWLATRSTDGPYGELIRIAKLVNHTVCRRALAADGPSCPFIFLSFFYLAIVYLTGASPSLLSGGSYEVASRSEDLSCFGTSAPPSPLHSGLKPRPRTSIHPCSLPICRVPRLRKWLREPCRRPKRVQDRTPASER
ncbi:hypothetical protein BV25DRAFT_1666031 [Artomyces pyxidatus]|uniref:Uncharacterized protein n=1 Tax=Artomyces pyxidatus TaxID=48021 RepID=A0ACB8SIQ2_9AGAM|nr:hypothetical protein BV25DRAFT_1666031 [Artomyces pyxidatus]